MRLRKLASWFSKPFVFFTIIMVLKMTLAQFVLYGVEGSLWWTVVAGVPSVWVVFGLVEWLFAKRKLGAYLVANLVMTCIYFAVIMYYKYYGVIVTYHAFQQLGQVTEVRGSVFSLLHPYFLFIYTDIVLFALLLATRPRVRAWGKGLAVRAPWRFVCSMLALSLAACTTTVWLHRDSINELRQAEGMGILNYQVYTAFANAMETSLDPNSVTPEAVAKVKGIELASGNAARLHGVAKGKNLIVLQLEAFQNFLIGLKVGGKEVTPNLNAFAREHLYFSRFYQQVGAGNTADAEYVVNTSFLVPEHGAASQDFGDRALPSLPKALAEQGYDTATFHTNDAEFWNRKQFYKALGFGRYYDKQFFGNDDFVGFGSSDEVLYAKTAQQLQKMKEAGKPFYAQIISMSSHHPFNFIPDEKLRFPLPDRYRDTMVGDYLQAQNYADYAFGQFVDELKREGLWDNSVIVVYGDHMGLPIYSLGRDENALMEEMIGRPYRYTEMLNIPLVLSIPGQAPAESIQVGGQADIFPTVANLLGIPLDGRVLFGQDLLNASQHVVPERYYLPTGSFVTDNGIFVPGDGFEDGTAYPFKDGKAASGSVASREAYDRALKLLAMSDSYVGHLPKRE